MLEIQTKNLAPDIVVLEITGRVTIGRECKQLEWATDSLVREKQQKKIIFDLSGVTHIDSTGVGIIVMSAGQVKQAGGELRLAGANKHIEQVLKLTSITNWSRGTQP
jgi:anti-sigma B factor antagonist